MKLFDAIRQSPVAMAVRTPSYREEVMVNVVLMDGTVPKAFDAPGDVAWTRRLLAFAKEHDDWEPAKRREWPFEVANVIERLGGISDAG